MIQDLPDALKEELIFHKFGNMIFKFHFLTKNGSSNLVWDMLKNLNKLTFDVNDTIYLDNSLANTIYLIHDGLDTLNFLQKTASLFKFTD